MKQTIFYLIITTLLALVMRFYHIDRVPLSLNWDEVTFAYNAYSLLETGRDEYGTVLPIQFPSIGDYKCPMYIYLLVPVVRLLGLTELAVRIPPALLGSLTIPLFYILTYSYFKNRKLALISSIFLAISPWHLQFTRAGADVGVSSFFVILGIVLFIRQRYLISLVSFVGAMYAYFADRLFVPLILLVLCIVYFKKIWHHKIYFGFSCLIAALLVTPLVLILLSPGHENKVRITTLLSYNIPQEVDPGLWLKTIYHNPFVEYGSLILDRYFNHFSPTFLFSQGLDDNRQRIAGMGMLFWSDAILLLALIKNKKPLVFILLWLLVSPIPAAITRAPVHARRSFEMVYPLMILLGLGWQAMSRNSKIIWGFVFSWAFIFYVMSYYTLTPLQTYKGAAGWQYGYKELVNFVSPLKQKYRSVIIDTGYQGPYIYFLFYEKYPPHLYQLQAKLIKKDPFDLGEGAGYDQYQFRNIFWPADRGLAKTLFAGPSDTLPDKDIDPKQSRLLKTIYFPDGTEAWRVVETF